MLNARDRGRTPVDSEYRWAIIMALNASALVNYEPQKETRRRTHKGNGDAALFDPLGNWADQTGSYS